MNASMCDLTSRELEIVSLLFELDNNKAIGKRLGISESAVKTHLTNVYQKIGVVSRLQAAVKFESHALKIKLDQQHADTAHGVRV